jgi:N-acetylated-alpha-linked acidic dipeptidase
MRATLVFVLAFAAVLAVAEPASPPQIHGFTAEGAIKESALESQFDSKLNRDDLRSWMQRLSARPHHVGSPYDKENAEFIASLFKSFGYETAIESFDVLLPTPKTRLVELVAPGHFTATLAEKPLSEDHTSNQTAEQLPTYNAFSADGDVTGELVYANYGVPADYEILERNGVDVRGKIVITRYGGSWRGIKPKVAAEHGAVGCLIYSDPRDDGYFQGDVFPAGPYRPKDGVQRGSVMDMPVYPGDPLTPGVGATKDAKRLALSDVKTFTKIPVLPISYGDAQPLLAALQGRVAPERWRGALPITYHVGPGAKVHLKVSFNWDLKPLYNVILRIPGADHPDEWIIRGNHLDAWVNGAEDPVSGAAAMLEEARGFGLLLKQGWKPKRTIIYCFWDGEEEGLLGSTEWAEEHAEELRRNGAVYINSDGNGRGFFGMAGSHTLEKFINGIARDIEDPEKQMPVWKRLQLSRLTSPNERKDARDRPDLRIGALGSGSDYTAFIDHLGVASLNIGFGGEDGGGIYHSIYDDYYWYTHFADTDFRYGRALAQAAGTAVMRLADAELLPYDFGNFTDTLRKYVEELQKLASGKRDEIRERNRQLEEGVFAATSDPKRPLLPPKKEAVPPFLNFAPLQNGLDAVARTAEHYDAVLAKATESGGSALARASLREVNARLIQVERALTLQDGLPNRPWFRHQIYAPGFYTGYGVKTIPAVRESIEQGEWKLADEQIVRVGKVLENTGEVIDSAASALQQATGQPRPAAAPPAR